MSDSIQPENVFSQRNADILAQALNVVINNATFYGGKHPSTQKNAEDFACRLDEVFAANPLITLLRNGDSLFIDKFCVDLRMNVARLVHTFHKAGIESISFEKGTTGQDVRAFIGIFSDTTAFPTADAMNAALSEQGVTKIRFNYVFFQKVTKDETVVSKDVAESNYFDPHSIDITESGSAIALSGHSQPRMSAESDQHKLFDQLDTLLSFQQMLEHPDSAAKVIINQANSGKDRSGEIIQHLKDFKEQVKSADGGPGALSLDEMMESVLTLTASLKNKLAVQENMGKISVEQQSVINEVDQLTYQTILKIVREEYKKGDISIKRLSQIIRRIMPDIKELKKLLPLLKEGLLADGMSLGDFLQLTKQLHNELVQEGVLEALEKGAEQIGLTVEDITRAISSNPNEAAKILVLASEIDQGTGGNPGALSGLLTDYIESVSQKIAVDNHDESPNHDGKALEQIIHEIESHLLVTLKKQGVEDGLVRDVETQLAERFPKTLQKLKADWVVQFITKGSDVTGSSMAQLLSSLVEHKSEVDSIKGPIENALRARGLNQSQIENVFGEIVSQFGQKTDSQTQPKNTLSSNNTKFFLQREIKENLRYHNPFSCLSILVDSQSTDGNNWQPVQKSSLVLFVQKICTILKGFLRDLDLIGTLGSLEDDSILIILPMTDENGAATVKQRLEKRFQQTDFGGAGRRMMLNILISITTFDKEKTPSYSSFKELVR